jgi:Papain-like cysteine protease AvrRpt2
MGYLPGAVSVEPQTSLHPYWCWASVTAAVWSYYEGVPWTMPEVVVLVLQPDCSGQFTSDQGGVYWDLSDALALDNPGCPNAAHNHLAQQAYGQVAFADLQNQIDNLQRPVCVAVTFETAPGQTVHYCLVNGIFEQEGEQWISLLDPGAISPGEQRLTFPDFVSGAALLPSSATYPATWSDTFYTQ